MSKVKGRLPARGIGCLQVDKNVAEKKRITTRIPWIWVEFLQPSTPKKKEHDPREVN